MYICIVKDYKKYMSISFICLLLLGVIDFHGLTHLLEGDHQQQIEACDDCSIVFQQKEDTSYVLTNLETRYSSFQTLEVRITHNYGNLIGVTHQLHPSDYFNKPPPVLA